MCTERDKSTDAEHEYTESRLQQLRADVEHAERELDRLKSEAESALESTGVAANVIDILDAVLGDGEADETHILAGTKTGLQLVLHYYGLPHRHRIVIKNAGEAVADYTPSKVGGYDVHVWHDGPWIGEVARAATRIRLRSEIDHLESRLGSIKPKLSRYRLGPDQEPDDHGRVGAAGEGAE